MEILIHLSCAFDEGKQASCIRCLILRERQKEKDYTSTEQSKIIDIIKHVQQVESELVTCTTVHFTKPWISILQP